MKRWVKGLGYATGALVVIVVLAGAGVYGFSESRLRRAVEVTPAPLTIPTDAVSLARGEHLVRSVGGCVGCHGENLAGGTVVEDAVFARVYARNLTRGKGGVGDSLNDADFVRAIRHGRAPDGRALKIMPSGDYAHFSDSDLAAVIAYVKSVPAVDRTTPAMSVGPIGRTLLVAGKLPLLPAEELTRDPVHPSAGTPGRTVEYGNYLASIGCKGCHGLALAGGPIAAGPPDWPPAANLTPAGNLKSWTEENFKQLLRTGKRPNGAPVNEAMPWPVMGRMTDDELHAIWMYLTSLPATQTANAK